MSIESFSYNSQLNWLSEQFALAKYENMPKKMQLYLSLAESVKKARDSELNTPLESPEEAYQRGLKDASTVIEHIRIPQRSLTLTHPQTLLDKISEALRIFSRGKENPRQFYYQIGAGYDGRIS